MLKDKHKNYEVVESVHKYKGIILNLRLDQVRFPNQRVFTREVVEHKGAVAIVPYCQDGSVILVRQYRHPVGEVLLEIPAGLIYADETAAQCAMRELKEETGAITEDVHKLAEFYTSPGYSNEKLHLFLAMVKSEYLAEPQEDELLEVEHVGLSQALQMIPEGQIRDGKTIVGLCLAQAYMGP